MPPAASEAIGSGPAELLSIGQDGSEQLVLAESAVVLENLTALLIQPFLGTKLFLLLSRKWLPLAEHLDQMLSFTIPHLLVVLDAGGKPLDQRRIRCFLTGTWASESEFGSHPVNAGRLHAHAAKCAADTSNPRTCSQAEEPPECWGHPVGSAPARWFRPRLRSRWMRRFVAS